MQKYVKHAANERYFYLDRNASLHKCLQIYLYGGSLPSRVFSLARTTLKVRKIYLYNAFLPSFLLSYFFNEVRETTLCGYLSHEYLLRYQAERKGVISVACWLTEYAVTFLTRVLSRSDGHNAACVRRISRDELYDTTRHDAFNMVHGIWLRCKPSSLQRRDELSSVRALYLEVTRCILAILKHLVQHVLTKYAVVKKRGTRLPVRVVSKIFL